ncbi:MAG: hypothetical protein KDC43_16170 [Saprospiraceae bacterium]|nr:hypothetical protein [Saprospiraceae bacterium]
MAARSKVNFQFRNHVAPKYVQPLLLQLEYGEWYSSTELMQLLRASGLDLKGKDIVQSNTNYWERIGLGEILRERPKPNLFRLSRLGKEVAALFSTNQPLFYDLMHFLFYSAWFRSQKPYHASFWLYAQICDRLWREAPAAMDSKALTGWLQAESRLAFPDFEPSFPTQSVRSVFPWLGALTPPFLLPCSSRSNLCSERRSYCTPQLFHLAVDLLYAVEGLNYDTSLAMDDKHIETISRVCLLDSKRFWDMASLTDMAIRELEIRKGQWGTSLALTGPPRWIELPDFSQQEVKEDEEESEDETEEEDE